MNIKNYIIAVNSGLVALLNRYNPNASAMNVPKVTFELKDGFLLVVGHGARNNLQEMNEAASEIYRKMDETQCYFLLVDYSELEINVHMAEAFNIVKRYELAQPDLKKATIAAVFSGAGTEFGKFWKEVGRKRGFTIESFDTIELAKEWLKSKMKA